jgi:hypothetical protein
MQEVRGKIFRGHVPFRHKDFFSIVFQSVRLFWNYLLINGLVLGFKQKVFFYIFVKIRNFANKYEIS